MIDMEYVMEMRMIEEEPCEAVILEDKEVKMREEPARKQSCKIQPTVSMPMGLKPSIL